jgi:hypothetical protein
MTYNNVRAFIIRCCGINNVYGPLRKAHAGITRHKDGPRELEGLQAVSDIDHPNIGDI